MSRRSRYTAGGLVRRQLAAEPGTAMLVAATVLLVSLVLSLWPRAVDTLLGDDLRDQLAGLSAAQRDPSGGGTWLPETRGEGALGSATPPPAGTVDGDELIAQWRTNVEVARDNAGAQVRQILGDAEVTFTRRRDPVDKGPRADDVYAMNLAVRMDPAIDDRVRMVDGVAPGDYDLTGLFADDASFGDLVAARPVDVMVSVQTAERMQWEVGETRGLIGVIPFQFHLVGTFEAIDPQAGYWSHLESTLFPSIVEDGNVGTTVNGVAYADPSALGALVVANGLRLDYWVTVDTDAAAGTDRAALLPELRGFLDTNAMTSELVDRLESVSVRQAGFTTVLDVLAVGPVGVALAVLWSAARLSAARRRTALALAGARGGSGTAIRSAMAAQGLVVGLPAAALGALAAALILPRHVGATAWLLPAIVGIAPAVLMALAAGPAMRPGDRRRPDAPPRRRGLRLGAEALTMALAALAVVTIRQRGITAPDPASGTDPLLVASPVLLAAAASVVALRLYPLPMRALSRALHARRRLPHFLGAAQATRSPHAGVTAVVALVLGVAISVFSAVTLSTVRAGVDHTAAAAVGADLRVDGEDLTPDDVAQVAGLNGVTATAAVGTAGRYPLDMNGAASTPTVLTVDGGSLAAVQRGLGLDPVPSLDASPTGAADDLPAVVGGADELDLERSISLLVGVDHEPMPLHAVAGLRSVPGATTGTDWVLVDDAAWRAVVGTTPRIDRLLVRVDGASSAAVADAITAALGPDVDVTSLDRVRDAVGSTALVRGVTVGLVAATGLAGLLGVVVVLLSLAVRAPERGRLAALLTTVGAPRGTASRLVAWEVWPLLLVSVVAGAVVGGVLPGLVLGSADLRAFTGGSVQPPVVVDPVALAALGGAAALTIALAAAVASVRARRRRAVVVLREEE